MRSAGVDHHAGEWHRGVASVQQALYLVRVSSEYLIIISCMLPSLTSVCSYIYIYVDG